MEKGINNKLSIFLMAGSLMLLLAFLLFWLQRVYQDEYAELEKETNFIFTNAVREVEDSFINKLILEPLVSQHADTASFTFKTVKNRTRAEGKTEGKQHLAIRSFNKTTRLESDSNFNVAIKKRLEASPDDHLSGSISLFIELSGDTIDPKSLPTFQGDSSLIAVLDTSLIALLDTKFGKAVQKTNIGLSYKIRKIETGDSVQNFWHSNTYTDLFSDASYAVSYDNCTPYLLRKMFPNILFSVFLFSCIALAFLMVYQNLQRQRKLTELKNDFISNVTHELKTPITTVGVAIEALSSFNALDDPKKTKEYLDISKHELDRLSILVDKVLKMSLFEKAEPELKLETFDLKALISEVLNSMKLQFEKYAARVDFNIVGKEFSIEADRIHLTSVIFNLIDNALKYSKNKPELNISLENRADLLQIMVADNGIGIEPEHQAKIFDKFFRVPTGDQHNTKGYGLGLSYVASVVKKHRGNIEVSSQPKQGTRFTITLPKRHEEN